MAEKLREEIDTVSKEAAAGAEDFAKKTEKGLFTECILKDSF